MREKSGARFVRARTKHFSVVIFSLTLIVLATLSTINNYILRSHIDYDAIKPHSVVIMVLYWILVSSGFTWITRTQIRREYEKPMQMLAKATKDVADGDFSVYVRPVHTSDRKDYLDVMIDDFNKMVAELGSIETLKTEFFTNVSHEIKTPLAVVQSNAEMLRKENITQRQRLEYTDAIIGSTKKLSGLITNILKLSRLEQQKIQPAPARYDLCAQLSECALQFEEVWEEKEINFEVELEDRAWVLADENLLELVWSNLLSNAFKFTAGGGTVKLVQTSMENEIVVSVSDTGCGMDDSTMKHIFDKFYQGDTSHATEGNGLGLALSLRILELMGGRVTVKSILGEGSEFAVRIPIPHPQEDENYEFR